MKKFNIKVNGNDYEVEVEEVKSTTVSAPSAPKAAPAPTPAPAPKAAPAPTPAPASAPVAGGTSIDAPMPGKITKVVATVGQSVNAGDVLLILEAMKMQNEITATGSGVVKAINVQVGQSVKTGDQMVVIG